MTVPKLRKAIQRNPPGLSFERDHWDAGRSVVAGIDEVGRGSWAGPLTVVAAVAPHDRRVYKVRDSKMLSERERESMFARIADWVDAWAVGHASPQECDSLGMSEAQRLATRRALGGLPGPVDAVLVDGNWDFVGHAHTQTIVKGDAKSLSIASASILAKVTRDRMMRAAAEHFPVYAFKDNKGYPCPRHKAALAGYGPSPIHRKSWVFMDHLPWNGLERLGSQERLF